LPKTTGNDERCLVELARGLDRATRALVFAPPVTHVYRPLEYAFAPHTRYLERYGSLGADTLLIGMNPGPFGMVQTGVPFGDVALARDWLGVEDVVERPPNEHPKRPIEGFATARGEVSGQRLWGWARDVYAQPEKFFARFFVWNYCPLAFLEASGRNRTPDKLPRAEREALFEPCDEALRELVRRMEPKHVVGIGRFAFDRLGALGDIGAAISVAPHPSPASPAANRGWRPLFETALRERGIALP
jgi:single-strand selective monofunctional uracil DNA glycosylase